MCFLQDENPWLGVHSALLNFNAQHGDTRLHALKLNSAH